MSKRTGHREGSLHRSRNTTPTPDLPLGPFAGDLYALASIHPFGEHQQLDSPLFFNTSSWMLDTSQVFSNPMDVDMPSYSSSESSSRDPRHVRDHSISSSISSASITTTATGDDLDSLFDLPSELQPSVPLPSPQVPSTSLTAQPPPMNAPTFPQSLPSSILGSGDPSTIICATTSHNGGATRDCITIALQLVADLQTSSRRPCVVPANGSDQFVVEDNQSHARDIDAVIQDNHTAIRKLDRILDCSCGRHQEVLITMFLAAHQTILWYEAALSPDNNNQDGKPAKAAAVASSTGARIGERVVTSQVTMGSYRLDLGAQVVVRAHVVLLEVRTHVQPLLTRLQQIRQTAAVAAPGPPAIDPTASPLESWDVVDCYLRALGDKVSAVVNKCNALKHG